MDRCSPHHCSLASEFVSVPPPRANGIKPDKNLEVSMGYLSLLPYSVFGITLTMCCGVFLVSALVIMFSSSQGDIFDNCLIPGLWFHRLELFTFPLKYLSQLHSCTMFWCSLCIVILSLCEAITNKIIFNTANREVYHKWWHYIGLLRMFTRATVAKQIKHG